MKRRPGPVDRGPWRRSSSVWPFALLVEGQQAAALWYLGARPSRSSGWCWRPQQLARRHGAVSEYLRRCQRRGTAGWGFGPRSADSGQDYNRGSTSPECRHERATIPASQARFGVESRPRRICSIQGRNGAPRSTQRTRNGRPIWTAATRVAIVQIAERDAAPRHPRARDLRPALSDTPSRILWSSPSHSCGDADDLVALAQLGV